MTPTRSSCSNQKSDRPNKDLEGAQNQRFLLYIRKTNTAHMNTTKNTLVQMYMQTAEKHRMSSA